MNKIFLSKVLKKLAVLDEDIKHDQNQLDKGMEVEREHTDTIKGILEDAEKGELKSLDDYIKKIVLDHLSEVENYYIDMEGKDRLKKLEDEAKKELESKKSAEEEIYPLASQLSTAEKTQVAKELLENLPEALRGSGLEATSWKYESMNFVIEDTEEGKEYKITKENAVKGLDKFLEAIKKGHLPGLRLNEKSTVGSFDGEAISDYVQFIIFGKKIYG